MFKGSRVDTPVVTLLFNRIIVLRLSEPPNWLLMASNLAEQPAMIVHVEVHSVGTDGSEKSIFYTASHKRESQCDFNDDLSSVKTNKRAFQLLLFPYTVCPWRMCENTRAHLSTLHIENTFTGLSQHITWHYRRGTWNGRLLNTRIHNVSLVLQFAASFETSRTFFANIYPNLQTFRVPR